MKLINLILLLFVAGSFVAEAQDKPEPVDLVYPQLDSENSRWIFFASACRPFGMVNLSPDNYANGDWGSGYRYERDSIKFFSHIHCWQLSGLPVLPVNGAFRGHLGPDVYGSPYSHERETVRPGYHSVVLDSYGIQAELTSTTRVGFHRYRFPKSAESYILLDMATFLGPSGTLKGAVKKISDREIQGYVLMDKTVRRPKEVYVYFVLQLDTPFERIMSWKDGRISGATDSFEGSNGGIFLKINTEKEKTVQMKVAVSYVSEEQARLNLQTELPHWDFDTVVSESAEEWNNYLGRIEIAGGTLQQQRRFYTDLWHALLGRRIISDVNGKYCDMTGTERRVGQIPLDKNGKPLFNHHNSDSFWGAQWTISTLWSLLYPKITSDFVNSMLMMYDDGGLIPRGPAGGNYTAVMTGASSTPFIVGAWMKGVRTFDAGKAFEGMKKNHMPGGMMGKAGYEHNSAIGGGIEFYIDQGYVPYPLLPKVGFHQDGAGQTLEYASQDWCLAQMANVLGKQDDYDYFLKRSGNWKNLFDGQTGWIRPKNKEGKWKDPFDPYQYQNGFVEANSSQTTWYVPHDLPGLARLMGGPEKAAAKLDESFKTAQKFDFTSGKSHSKELMEQYRRIPINYGNQPSIQTAFIFNHLGYPWLTQYWSRRVIEQAFSALSPDQGYNGDEDQGLMGSLAVLMKIGLFEMNSGCEPRSVIELGSPIFDKIILHLDQSYYPGKTFTIEVKNNKPGNDYIQSAILNGNPLEKWWFYHQDITRGGKLVLEMGEKPNKTIFSSGQTKTVWLDEEWPQKSALPVHPRYLEIPVPSGGTEVRQNPPVLRWPRERGKNIAYEVMLSQDPLFEDNRNMMKAKTTMAVYNPHRKLNPGIWYWKYRKNGGSFSKPQEFVVRSNATNLASPPAEEFLKSVPADHPRILLQKNEAERFRTFQDDPDARAIITQAQKYLTAPVPSEKDAWSGKKMDDPDQQRKLDLDASQDASSAVYEKIITLSQAYVLTGNQAFSAKAISMGMEVSSWDPEGVTRLSDFGDARCMLGMALVFDTFYDQLDEKQKEKLVWASSARAANFYKSWINDIETKVLSGHVWQHILHYFFQTALALHGEEPLAEQWLTYAYELFLARAPVLGGPDGGWVEGVSYFRMNMETMIDIPLFIQKFTGFDFIGSHPWYRGNTKWMIYHIPPGSAADGFGDNTEEVLSPGAAYLAYAQEMAKLNNDTPAAWYAREVRKYENPDLSATQVLRWVRLTKTRGLKMPEIKNDPALPMAVVFRETGLAAIHSDPGNTPDNLMVAFKSSPFGSYGHMLCDQNTFNILYGGKKLFYRTGYKITMDDPHRTGWYQTTKSQNGILINDQGQTYSNNAFGWISRFMQGDEIAYIKGDATNAYKNEETGKPEVKKVIRHLVLIKPDLIIIYDELESEKDARWGWLIHSSQKMKTDPANSTFSVTLPGVKGSGKIFSSQEVRWAVTDTFEVPAVNWRKSRYPDGRLKTYDDPQWHLKVTGHQESKAMRYLTILQISPKADLNQILTENKPGKNRNVDLAIGQWSVSANLKTDVPPGLMIRKKDGRVAFSIDSKEINLKGEIVNGNQENSSLLIEKKNGQPFIQEAGDSIPEAMRNVLLYH